MLDFSKLKGHVPDNIYEGLLLVTIDFKINSILRLAHFLSQCSYESAEFRLVEEGLNYSKEGLLRVFPKYFNDELASSLARKPKLIASRVYANRMGNGDEVSQDGWKYRGRGYIQLTGKSNYKSFDSVCNDNIVDNPDLVAIKYPLVSAGWFWQNHKLNEIADKGIDTEVVSKITKVINGGTNGLSDRIILFNKYLGILKHE